jgi:hypothetical protein
LTGSPQAILLAMTIDLIAFDADDTLWHNETIFVRAQGKFKWISGLKAMPNISAADTVTV